ncbi:STAS domain-containing protein [Marinobacterium rhizophilum]|uniref:STAS domain-containing protein n=1 Tax=Marinobacterium rhizophilum TaxID=420402 RepID=A0ABY5HPU6_9GAMM|nr:STAS domain-containing protein [Marinobacterium rhizophilum]UTW13994.1 STAS domain-containing protein [Marinobacterium rhizophilum]
MQASVEVRAADEVALSGDLRFATVAGVRERLERLIATGESACVVDFSAVSSVDSAALSLWLCCQREARERNIQLQARHVPEDLLSIARLVGLGHLFGDADAALL